MQYVLYDCLRIGGRGGWRIERAAHRAQEGSVIAAWDTVWYGMVCYVKRQR